MVASLPSLFRLNARKLPDSTKYSFLQSLPCIISNQFLKTSSTEKVTKVLSGQKRLN